MTGAGTLGAGLEGMDVAHRLRITLASVIALAAAGSIALAGTVEAGAPAEPLVPDLRTVAAGGFGLMLKQKGSGQVVLRISNKVANQGDGPLELYATDATASGGPGGSTDCTVGEYPEPVGADRDANQVIFEDTDDDGKYDPDDSDPDAEPPVVDDDVDQVSEEPKVGCFEYHEAHGHWHFQDFAQFRLDDVATGDTVAGPSRKIGFCILDGERRYPGLPGSPQSGVYPSNTPFGAGCGLGQPEVGPGAMGLSVGWADIYTYTLPGQRLDITGVPKGTYCLVSIANPPGGNSEIVESDAANNERRRQIRINPDKDKVELLHLDCPDPTP